MLGTATPASAINSYNAEPAPERTEVGALVVQSDRDNDPATPDAVRWSCTGTMISTGVFLTAAHCTVGRPAGTKFYVSLAQDVQGAIDASNALGGTPEQIAARVGVQGVAYSDPGYPGNQADSHDIAVIKFNAGQAAELAQRWPFVPATLPHHNQLSELGSRALDAKDWQVMGYGTQEAVNGPDGQTHPGGGVRMKAPVDFNALNKTWVRLAMNESRDLGGACYGDSGGPNFINLDGKLVLAATTITGDIPCYATNVTYRTDSDSARNFLQQFVALP
ncbi:trypsin-like serine protease [Sphaerisporangium perillae]|uniref:trypsin-like serine protease n=1 Tax=Sphaerisporangium perillae TaxID=2935860 RepID=UPI00200DE988|nr:trypsin-like serine protease [Sphaerisporangium perillae]